MSPSATSLAPARPILAIAVRAAEGGAMREIQSAVVRADGGLVDDTPHSPDRGLTLLSARQWAAVTRQLGVALPWHTRRANLLIDADSLADLIGCRCRIGQVELRVTAETTPCGLMDRLHPGLRAALRPEMRGGVCARVLTGGTIQVGDALTVVGDA